MVADRLGTVWIYMRRVDLDWVNQVRNCFGKTGLEKRETKNCHNLVRVSLVEAVVQ